VGLNNKSILFHVRFQVLTAASMNLTVLGLHGVISQKAVIFNSVTLLLLLYVFNKLKIISEKHSIYCNFVRFKTETDTLTNSS
jgi:hypothetical protein